MRPVPFDNPKARIVSEADFPFFSHLFKDVVVWILLSLEMARFGKSGDQANILGAQFVFGPIGLRFLVTVFPDNQRTGSHWTGAPFVAREKIRIGRKFLKGNRNMADGLRPVYDEQRGM